MLIEFERLGSLAAVAESLSYSKSAVSQQMATLQKEVGAELVLKRGKALELTDQGHAMVRVAKKVLRELEDATTAIAREQGTLSGMLRIACLQSVTQKLLPQAISLLSERHPQLSIELVQDETIESVQSLIGGTVHVAIGEQFENVTVPLHQNVALIDLFSEPMMMAARPDVMDLGASVDQLAKQRWVLEPPSSPCGRWALDWCRRRGFEPRVQFVSEDLLSHIRLIEHGLAVGFLPHLVSPDVSDRVSMHAVTDGTRQVHLSTRVPMCEHPAVLELAETLQDLHIQTLPPSNNG
ncbi:MAG: LysR family transcriptional regulator [Ancrocorticia sp.]